MTHQRIHEAVLASPDVTTEPGRFGSTRYLVGRRELGHVHDDGHLDLPLPRRMRDELVRAGRAEPHRFVPDSGWATRQLRKDTDVDDAIALLRNQYERARRTGRYEVPRDEG